MANPRKRKARILEALTKAANNAETEEEKLIVNITANISVESGKFTQAEIDEAITPMQQKEDPRAEEKQDTSKGPAKTKKKATAKRTTKRTAKRTAKRTTKGKKTKTKK